MSNSPSLSMNLTRPTGMPCPECKTPIVVDPATLLGAQSISCQGCGLQLHIDKKQSAHTLQALSQYLNRMQQLEAKVTNAQPSAPKPARGTRAPRRRTTRRAR